MRQSSGNDLENISYAINNSEEAARTLTSFIASQKDVQYWNQQLTEAADRLRGMSAAISIAYFTEGDYKPEGSLRSKYRKKTAIDAELMQEYYLRSCREDINECDRFVKDMEKTWNYYDSSHSVNLWRVSSLGKFVDGVELGKKILEDFYESWTVIASPALQETIDLLHKARSHLREVSLRPSEITGFSPLVGAIKNLEENDKDYPMVLKRISTAVTGLSSLHYLLARQSPSSNG